MSLKEALDEMMSNVDSILEAEVKYSLKKLPDEDQEALRSFFRDWAKTADTLPAGVSSASLIALGFILGHNWVRDRWTLW